MQIWYLKRVQILTKSLMFIRLVKTNFPPLEMPSMVDNIWLAMTWLLYLTRQTK